MQCMQRYVIPLPDIVSMLCNVCCWRVHICVGIPISGIFHVQVPVEKHAIVSIACDALLPLCGICPFGMCCLHASPRERAKGAIRYPSLNSKDTLKPTFVHRTFCKTLIVPFQGHPYFFCSRTLSRSCTHSQIWAHFLTSFKILTLEFELMLLKVCCKCGGVVVVGKCI